MEGYHHGLANDETGAVEWLITFKRLLESPINCLQELSIPCLATLYNQ